MILKCTCKHTGQDKLYGEGMRVHNRCKGAMDKMTRAKCTVCKSEKEVGEANG